MRERIQPRLVVRDERGDEGIVAQPEPRPSARWLAEQINPISPEASASQWWGVLSMHGGYILAPEPLLEALRPASYEDFLAAVEEGNVAARKRLAELFPDYVARAMTTTGREP